MWVVWVFYYTYIFIFINFCVYTYRQMCHGAHVEVRGLVGDDSISCNFWSYSLGSNHCNALIKNAAGSLVAAAAETLQVPEQ